ncbi:MAG TPA: hypothetical protein VHU84_12365 [Lacipirellulaceae bacterium]|nr:hypothetical protein [Lacipirellulaceae bacterium]
MKTFLGSRDGDRSSQPNTVQSNGKSAVYGQQVQQGARNFQTLRPTDDQVRSFLQLRGNENARLAENDDHKPGNKGHNDDNGQNGSRGQNGGKNDDKHFGDNPSSKNVGSFNGQSNRSNLPGNSGPKFDWKNGDHNDKNGDHDNKGAFDHKVVGDGKNFDHNNHDRDFHGSDSAKVEFSKWNNSWKGKNGNGHDNRDWSGKWRSGDRFVVADHIRNDWSHRHDFNNYPFRYGWYGHGHGWGFWGDYAFHHNRPWYWWGWTTGPILTDWCGFGWSTPYYWDYGPGEYIYCNDGVVYVNGRWYEPAPVFYAQTVRLIDQAPVLNVDAAAQAEWLPLGVFSVTPDGLNEPTMLVQLAVTKDGVMGGTVSDQKLGTSYNVQGTVDKNTQRAVWSYMNDKNERIVMETSVNNLTQNESTGLIHYNPNDMRVVELVRLPEPTGAAGDLPNPAAGAGAPPITIPTPQ